MPKTKTRPPRLGRGLTSLMAQPIAVDLNTAGSPSEAAAEEDKPIGPNGEIRLVTLDAISPNPNQPRQQFDAAALNELAESIRTDGLIQPIIVRTPEATSPEATSPDQTAPPKYELIAGERRWRAAAIAGLAQIPVIVRQIDDHQSIAWALIENLQRRDLNAIERALGFQDLAQRFDLSHEQVAQRVGIDRATVSNSLRLLGLCDFVRQLVQDRLLSAGHAKALAGLDQADRQQLLAESVIRQGWSVRRLEQEVRRLTTEHPTATDTPKVDSSAGGSAHLADLEAQLARQLGMKVRVRPGPKKGSGTLSITFQSLDQFDQLLERLGVETN
jgi:ParB family chromosome partitioning protein